jgi:hypothetical protein
VLVQNLSLTLAVSGFIIIANILREPPPQATKEMFLRHVTTMLAFLVFTGTCFAFGYHFQEAESHQVPAVIFVIVGIFSNFCWFMSLGFMSVVYEEWREAKKAAEEPKTRQP